MLIIEPIAILLKLKLFYTHKYSEHMDNFLDFFYNLKGKNFCLLF